MMIILWEPTAGVPKAIGPNKPLLDDAHTACDDAAIGLQESGVDVEWDEDKGRSNEAKHGVSFPEAATVFGDPLAVTFDDPLHSANELRYLTIGLSSYGRVLIVSHTDRTGVTRIISARAASRAERKGYEDGNYPRT